MPHRFKRSRTSRSHSDLCSSRCNPPPNYRPPHCPPSSPPMAYPTPRRQKQPAESFSDHDATQASESNMAGWKVEVYDKIVELCVGIDEFLYRLVPSHGVPPRSAAQRPFDVPVGQAETSMYGPLCTGLEKLVERFELDKRPSFFNNAHQPIKFPFLLGQQAHHATKPDVVVSLPGQKFDQRFPDRWRNISVAFEAKNTNNQDPMLYCSSANDETLVQLSKSARNILIAQSRLFVFVIGVYGSVARIFRFDHAGALCSPPFEYGDGVVLHEFLWRLVHPLDEGCDIVGADPTVALLSEGNQEAKQELRNKAQRQLDAGGVKFSPETRKACRWVKVRGAEGELKTYLLYELTFINPRLFSRATTVWKALELDKDGNPTGQHVIIKDAWRQLARRPETDSYRQIYAHFVADRIDGDPEAVDKDMFIERWSVEWLGLALCTLGDDLGEEAAEERRRAVEERQRDSEEHQGDSEEWPCHPIGQQTCTGIYHANGEHPYFERSHIRLVSSTVGTPISQFQSTKELTQAIRDAIHGHRVAFRAGIMHRDVSEGNVMIANGRGFLHDLDYGFNWKTFLRERGLEDTMESWEKFVRTETSIPSDGARLPEPPSNTRGSGTESHAPPRAIIVKGHKEYFVKRILAERYIRNPKLKPNSSSRSDSKSKSKRKPRQYKRQRQYLVEWAGPGERTWEPYGNVKRCQALEEWRTLSPEERRQLSNPHLDAGADQPATEGDGRKDQSVEATNSMDPVEEARMMMECKQRTGTFYFMAVEVLRRKDIVHEVRHDLESFYWLLLWLVLRHTNHSCWDMHKRMRALFDAETDAICADTKKGWLGTKFFVYDNAPLSHLLKRFSDLCDGNSHKDGESRAPAPLTYESVLKIFDDVLKRDDWPEGDKALSFKPADDPNPAHQERPSFTNSTWVSSGNSQAPRNRRQLRDAAQGAVMLPHSRRDNVPAQTSRLGAARQFVSTTRARPQLTTGSPRATSRVGYGAGPAIMPRREPPVPRGMPSRPDPDSPSPSSRRGTSTHSLMLPPSVPSYARSLLPDFDGPPDSTESRLPALRLEGTNMLPTPSLSSRSSSSAQSKQGESSKARRTRSGRKRSHEEFVANEAEPEAESSKRSRTRTNSERRPVLPRKASAKRPNKPHRD